MTLQKTNKVTIVVRRQRGIIANLHSLKGIYIITNTSLYKEDALAN